MTNPLKTLQIKRTWFTWTPHFCHYNVSFDRKVTVWWCSLFGWEVGCFVNTERPARIIRRPVTFGRVRRSFPLRALGRVVFWFNPALGASISTKKANGVVCGPFGCCCVSDEHAE